MPVFFTAKSSIASWKLCMLALTLASRARSCMATKFGIAIAARIPMITTTIMSSMRVKPFSLRSIGLSWVGGWLSLAVLEHEAERSGLSIARDRIVRRGRVRRKTALRGRNASPRRRSLVRHARERVGRIRAAREVRVHRSRVRRDRVDARVLHSEVFDRQLEAVHVRLDAGLTRTVLHGHEVRNGDRGENTDDHDHDHELDEGEALFVAQHWTLLGWGLAILSR